MVTELERLLQLHDVLELELGFLTRHARLTPGEQQEIQRVNRQRLQVKDRIVLARRSILPRSSEYGSEYARSG